MQVQACPNLVQGVSQQAAAQRRDSQCEAQFDCINDASEGCIPRPGATYIAKLNHYTSLADAYFYEVVRDDDENYLVGVADEEPFAINLATGLVRYPTSGITVSSPDSYLDAIPGENVKDNYRAKVVEDTIFLANRLVKPAMAASPVSSSRYPEAILYVRSGAYDMYFRAILVCGVTTTTLSVLTDSSHLYGANTTFIAAHMATLINTTYAADGYTAVDYGGLLHITRADHADFTIDTDDGHGGEFMYAIKDRVTAFEKLPPIIVEDFLVRVGGENKKVEDDYYMVGVGSGITGHWEERTGPGLKTTIDGETMPHKLVNTALNTFTYGPVSWGTRVVGDETTAKDPSFIGKYPRDIFYHQNRLGILVENGAVWSKSQNPFVYFPDTVQVKLDEAPIDVNLIGGDNSKGAQNMDFAVQWSEQLSMWSPSQQFRITWGQNGFTQDTIDAPPSTAYEYSRQSSPQAVSAILFFASDVGEWSALRGLQSDGAKIIGDLSTTAHVKRYIPKGIRWLTASDLLGSLWVVSDVEPNAIYHYNFLLDGTEYIQSAWNKWRLGGGDILWLGYRKGKLRAIQQRASEGILLLGFDLNPGVVDPVDNASYDTRLDYRVDETQVSAPVYNSGTNTSSFKLPWKANDTTGVVVVSYETNTDPGGRPRGYQWEVTQISGAPDGDTVTVKGDITGSRFYAGSPISAERWESRLMIRSDKGPLPYDQIAVDSYLLEYDRTGYTRLECVHKDGTLKHYVEWDSRTSGLYDSVSGEPTLRSDSLALDIGEDARNVTVKLINDSWLPSAWLSASWFYDAVGRAGQKGSR